MQSKVYSAIGLMSGSSLDGVDIAYCHFNQNGAWNFSIEETICVPYSILWEKRLRNARHIDGQSLWQLHADLGNYFGSITKTFIEQLSLQGKVDFVASHGHTVFHFPEQKFTSQIGDGAALAAAVGVPVVCDFRTTDIALGGQGTPIVPIADWHLFRQHKLLLNLGGIANISAKVNESIRAFDVCAANQVLNFLAQQLGSAFDADGRLAKSGKLDHSLFDKLNALPYFEQEFPKSLDNGFSQLAIIPLLESFHISTEDKLHTVCEHIAYQVQQHIAKIAVKTQTIFEKKDSILITGGGAFNGFLLERIAAHTEVQVVVPDEKTVKYKEALAMAFMGVLRLCGEVNVLHAVTGASRDSVGGSIYFSPTLPL